MLPVRCVTCNNVIGHLWYEYIRLQKLSDDNKQVLENLNLKRVCCRRMLLGHVPITQDTAHYGKQDVTLDECGTMFLCKVPNERVVECA